MRRPDPLISIVTVVLNYRDGLKGTEESVSCQTFRNYEWLVVDGGSRDGSADIPRTSDIEPLKWVSEPDRGLYDAMNKGVKMATGRYVLFLNAGDKLAGEKVTEDIAQLIAEVLSREQTAPVIMGGFNLVLPQGGKVYKPPRRVEYIRHSLPTSHQAIFFPSDFIKHHPYDVTYRICGDYYIAALAYRVGRNFLAVDVSVADFELGGLSYRQPLALMHEAMRIQRTVLELGYPTIFASAMYRAAKMLGIRMLARIPSLAKMRNLRPLRSVNNEESGA